MRTSALIITFAILMLTPLATANVTQETDSHTFTVGWIQQPPTAGENNAIVMYVVDTKTELPVVGLTGDLVVTARFADQSKTLVLTESTQVPGQYGAGLEPTKAGSYTIHVGGNFANDTIDADFALDAVVETAGDRFPLDMSDTNDLATTVAALSARVGALEAKATTLANTPATVTVQPSPVDAAPVPFVGATALIGIAALLGMRKRRP